MIFYKYGIFILWTIYASSLFFCTNYSKKTLLLPLKRNEDKKFLILFSNKFLYFWLNDLIMLCLILFFAICNLGMYLVINYNFFFLLTYYFFILDVFISN